MSPSNSEETWGDNNNNSTSSSGENTSSTSTSTSNKNQCKPFWNGKSKEWTKKLWLCRKSDLQELESINWNPSSQRLTQNSWFTVKMEQYIGNSDSTNENSSSSSSPCLWQVITENENEQKKTKGGGNEQNQKQRQSKKQKKTKEEEEEIEPESNSECVEADVAEKVEERQEAKRKGEEDETAPIRTKKIRVYPTTEQRQVLNQWFGTNRFLYNKLVEAYEDVGRFVSLRDMRAVVYGYVYHPEYSWLKETPSTVRDCAVRDMDKARKAHFAKVRKMRANDPNARLNAKFKFRSKRDPSQSFEFNARDWGRKKGKFASIFAKDKLKSSELLPEQLNFTIRVVKDRLGRFFLCIPQYANRSDSQAPSPQSHSVASVDPGVRTFLTVYDADGFVVELSKRDMDKIFRLCMSIDSIQSRMTKVKGKKRRRMNKAKLRMHDKVKNLVRDAHHKFAKWLCENYRVVLIPRFETSRMVKRGKRKIRSKTARQMCTWSHYTFRQILHQKAELHPWVKVVECEEPYTSKTCGECGHIHRKLGGSKTFTCPSCKFNSDRDVNGARNILLRYLSLYVDKHTGEAAFPEEEGKS